MRSIGDSIDSMGLRERGDLPRRITTTNPRYASVVFTWDDQRGVFVAEHNPDLVALPWIVRGLFGASFFPASPDPIYKDSLEITYAQG